MISVGGLRAGILLTMLCAACDAPTSPSAAWDYHATQYGVVATTGDWIVTAGGEKLRGMNVYYRGEPIGGGWTRNGWVPFMGPTNPDYSELASFAVRGDTLVLNFLDSIALPNRPALRVDIGIVAEPVRLIFRFGGMHLLFFTMRTAETWTIATRSSTVDTTLTIAASSPDWQRDFAGPSSYQIRGAHFDMDFSTDAPLMKIGIGQDAVPSGGIVKFDLDHSFLVDPPVYHVNSKLEVRAKY
jgi:hypothetical protein